MYLLGGVILAFILLVVYLAKTGKFLSAEKLSLATAVIDPLTYSVWIPVLGDYGGLMIGVYLFTILGYGFRIGVVHLQICQVSAIAGFAMVFFVSEFWKSHPIIWLSFLAILILVPVYASLLLRKLHEAVRHGFI